MVRARELRFVFVFDDYQAAARLYRDGSGRRTACSSPCSSRRSRWVPLFLILRCPSSADS